MNKPTIKMWLGRLGRTGEFIAAVFGLVIAVFSFMLLGTIKVLGAIWTEISDYYHYRFDGGAFISFVLIAVSIAFFPFFIYNARHLNKSVPAAELQMNIKQSACMKARIDNHLADTKAAPINYLIFYEMQSGCRDADALVKQREVIK